MKKYFVSLNRTYSIGTLAAILFLVLMVQGSQGFSQTCIDEVKTPVTLDGIIKGAKFQGIGVPPIPCLNDPGWSGVAARQLLDDQGNAASNRTIFIAGYDANNDNTLDKIYMGLHVEDDKSLNNLDTLLVYLDVDGNGAWGDGDKAFLFNLVQANLSTADSEFCDANDPNKKGDVRYFLYSGGVWTEPQSGLPANWIEHQIAWDYCDNINAQPIPCDTEKEIYELEISFDVANLGLDVEVINTSDVFRVAAGLYLDVTIGEDPDEFMTYRWPTNPLNDEFLDLMTGEPSMGQITPNLLALLEFGVCGDVVVTGIFANSSTSSGSQVNRLDRYTSNDFTNGTLLESEQNQFDATVRFESNATGPTLANEGKVKFYIRPWNGSFLVGEDKYFIHEEEVEFTEYNQERHVLFTWPETIGQYIDGNGQPQQHLANSDHSCYKVLLEGFSINSSITNDEQRRNIYYVSASTITDTFLISAVGAQPPPGGGSLEYVLRVDSRNIPRNSMKPAFGKNTLLSAAGSRKSKFGYYDEKPRYKYEKWDFNFTNAREIGLRSLGNGHYSVKLEPGEEKHVGISITGGKMPNRLSRNTYNIYPKAGESVYGNPNGKKPLDISAIPGKIMTVIASGVVNVDPADNNIQATGPDGFYNSSFNNDEFLLPRGYYEPSDQIGALIASFDGFNTAFVVGSNCTFVVPDGVNKVSLAVNDMKNSYGNNTGEGYHLIVITTDGFKPPMRIPISGNKKFGIPARFEEGSNLPGFNVDVFQRVPVKDQNGKVKAHQLKYTGYVGYAVQDSHPRKIYLPYELTLPFAGYTFFDKTLELENGPVLGAKLGYCIAGPLTLELEAGLGFTEDDTGDKGNWIQLMGNLRYHFSIFSSSITPFVTVGAGYVLFRGFVQNDSAFALQGGLGLTFNFSQTFGLRFEGKVLRLAPVLTAPATTNYQVTGGLVFWF